MLHIAIVVSLLVLFPSYATGEQISVATWNIQYLSERGDQKRTPENYERLRQIAESLEADVIALQEVDDAFVGRVFDPDTSHFELSGRNSALKTGLAIRRGIQYERKATVTALDVGDLRYGTHIELPVGPPRIDVLSIHLQAGCFSHKEEEWSDSRLQAGRAMRVLGDCNRRLTVENDRVWRERAAGEPEIMMLATVHTQPRCGDGYDRAFIDPILVGPTPPHWRSRFQEVVLSEAATTEGRAVWEERIADHCP